MKFRTIALTAVVSVLLAGCGVATLPPATGDEPYVPLNCAVGEEESNGMCVPADQPCPGYDVCPGEEGTPPVVAPVEEAPKPEPTPKARAPMPVAPPAPEPTKSGC